MSLGIHPPVYQSYELSYSDWASVFTLCFAPLVAHMAAGAPRMSYISDTAPRWHDYIGLYNPTSIMWRYYAVISRRIRAKQWDELDMVTANTAFWTLRGWDGSDNIAARVRSRHYWKRLPERGSPTWSSLLQTTIVTLQGLQAVGVFVGGVPELDGKGMALVGNAAGFGLDTIFLPFAVMGVIRLFSAFWLTDDYEFAKLTNATSDEELPHQKEMSLISVTDYGHFGSDWSKSQAQLYYRSPACWPDRAARLILFLFLVGLLVICVLQLSPWASYHRKWVVASDFFMNLFYQIIIVVSAIIFARYFIHEALVGSTIIPCVNSPVYKAYTAALYCSMVALVVIAAIETRKTPCGPYTTSPELDGWKDTSLCPNLVQLAPGEDQLPFGLATRYPGWGGFPSMSISSTEFVVSPFVGTCQGHFNASQAQRVTPVPVMVAGGT